MGPSPHGGESWFGNFAARFKLDQILEWDWSAHADRVLEQLLLFVERSQVLAEQASAAAWQFLQEVPVEAWQDALGWLLVLASFLWLLHFVLGRHPRICGAAVLAWLAWLGLEVLQKGTSVLQATIQRGQVALEATQDFMLHSRVMVQAWLLVFLPFLSDICRYASKLWSSLSAQQRLVIVCSVVFVYVVASIVSRIAAWRRNRRARRSAMGTGSSAGAVLRMVLFHLSFPVAAYFAWRLTGRMPAQWLCISLELLLRVVPTIGSLLALGWQPLASASSHKVVHKDQSTSRPPAQVSWTSRLWRRNSAAKNPQPQQPFLQGSPELQRRWLTFWAIWPLLVLLLELSHMDPRHFDKVRALQVNMQRGLVVFMLWLQLWGGSKHLMALLGRLRWLCTRLATPTQEVGQLQQGQQLLNSAGAVLQGGMGIAGPSLMTSWRLLDRINSTKRWVWGLAAATILILSGVLVYFFYRAYILAQRILTAALWCFVAYDTSTTLALSGNELLASKLAFWVLAMLWQGLMLLPVVGSFLRLFSLVAHVAFYVSAEIILRKVALPLLTLATASLAHAWPGVRSSFGLVMRGAQTARHEEEAPETDEQASLTDIAAPAGAVDGSTASEPAAPVPAEPAALSGQTHEGVGNEDAVDMPSQAQQDAPAEAMEAPAEDTAQTPEAVAVVPTQSLDGTSGCGEAATTPSRGHRLRRRGRQSPVQPS
eukprot:TRINITY_DN16278_c0_g1_i1.p1 TRINITY_DN16278_c0_g1~~TRINITY_DN16278_c0_g1_i1.p1  ORF type:complete len:710 (+),score=126.61 TRINITY_DN16278_c0_g1_i1:49-2178(+)